MQFYLPLTLTTLLLSINTVAAAQDVRPATALTSAARSAVVLALGGHLRSDYVFADTGKKLADALTAKLARGGYNTATTPQALEAALTEDLRAIGKDAHLRVRFAPEFRAPTSNGKPMNPDQVAMVRGSVAERAFGISRVQRLAGNVGYLDLRGFGPTEFVAEAYTQAIGLLSGTDALIIDLRQNGGGDPSSVAELISHFFPEGDSRHLNDIYSRTDGTTRSYWTNPAVTVRYTKSIMVLTSHDTFSGGEEFAYDLQTQKRAVVIGETTGGGANPGDNVPLAEGFIAFIPTGRAINPITKTNWEHVGVAPDVMVPAAAAMKAAYVAILKDLIEKARDPEQRQGLSGTLASLEKDEIQLPIYTPRR